MEGWINLYESSRSFRFCRKTLWGRLDDEFCKSTRLYRNWSAITYIAVDFFLFVIIWMKVVIKDLLIPIGTMYNVRLNGCLQIVRGGE